MFSRFHFALICLVSAGCSKQESGVAACFDTTKPQEERYASCAQQCEKNKAACAMAEDLRPAHKNAGTAAATAAEPTAATPAAATTTAKTTAVDMKKLADAAKRSVTSGDALRLRELTHPTGKGGTLGSVTVRQSDDDVRVSIPVEWYGGFTKSPYETVYEWRLDSRGGSELSIASDTAVISIDARHRAAADNFLKSKRAQLTL
jgi:hypothetical protein